MKLYIVTNPKMNGVAYLSHYMSPIFERKDGKALVERPQDLLGKLPRERVWVDEATLTEV